MSKHHRITAQERIRRNRQSNADAFRHWCQRRRLSETHDDLILYRLLGGKRYRGKPWHQPHSAKGGVA